MDLLRGATLEEHLLRRGHLAPARVVAIALQLCKALARLHACGVIHRDLKPSNIFLLRNRDHNHRHRDRIKLLDLGIAKLTAAFYASDANTTPPEDRLRTRAGVVLGTPGYIAPELLHGDRDPHPRHDIFALGITLFKVATGTSPYAHPHAAAVGDPPRPAPNLPRALEQLLHTAVAGDPTARYQSIAEVQDDLELLRDELAAVAHTIDTSPKRPSNPSTPRPPPSAEAPRETSPPADLGPSLSDRAPASSPTSTPSPARIRRSLPWLIAAALALGWLAGAHCLDTQPGALITRTQAHASSLLRAAEIALPTIEPSTALAPGAAHLETMIDSPTNATSPSIAQRDPAASSASAPPPRSRASPGRAARRGPAASSASDPPSRSGPTAASTREPSPTSGPSPTRRSSDVATTSPSSQSPPPRTALTRADIHRALADRRAALDLCLPGDSPVDLRLVIAADGHLRRATTIPAGSTLGQRCIAEALTNLRLPAAGAPSTHTIHLREP